MFGYLLRKLLLAVPLVLGVITLTFLMIQLAPGDATDRFFTPETPPAVRQMIAAKWGLDQPAYVQYGRMMANLLLGDFGRSISQERPVFDIIAEALPNTLQLAGVGLGVVYTVGVLLGIVQAVRQYSALDASLSVVSLFLYAMPSFWLALMLVLIFSLKLGILPSSGMKDGVMYDFMSWGGQIRDRVLHLILPGVAIGVADAAGIARFMRSNMLEVIRQDYIRTARAKGLSAFTVIFKHALRNALLPIVTMLGLSLPALFGGTVLVEQIFAWPGMGRVIVAAILAQDTPLVVACFFVFSLLVILGELLADILVSLVDPRIRLR